MTVQTVNSSTGSTNSLAAPTVLTVSSSIGVGSVADSISIDVNTESKGFFSCIQSVIESIASGVRGFFNSILACFGFGQAIKELPTESSAPVPSGSVDILLALIFDKINWDLGCGGTEEVSEMDILDYYKNNLTSDVRSKIDHQIWVLDGSRKNAGKDFGHRTFLARPLSPLVRAAVEKVFLTDSNC